MSNYKWEEATIIAALDGGDNEPQSAMSVACSSFCMGGVAEEWPLIRVERVLERLTSLGILRCNAFHRYTLIPSDEWGTS